MFFGLSSSFEETYCVFCGTLGTIKRDLCALFDTWAAVEQQIFLGNDNEPSNDDVWCRACFDCAPLKGN